MTFDRTAETRFALRACALAALGALTACVTTEPEVGGGQKTAVTGAAGGSATANANSALEHCDTTLGTIGV